jgi:holo-[acyl-carrier protein] synthase
MIYGIGIDVVHIDRMRIVVEKWGQRFLKRVFTDREIAYCYKKKNPYLSLAVRFAAKEAMIKAIGSEIPLSFTDIEVVNIGNGKPVFKFKEKLEIFFQMKNIKATHLSLSHEHEYGVACAVLEQ